MSDPLARSTAEASLPDDTAPALRHARGYVCPKCDARYEEGEPSLMCPNDSTYLVRLADLASADGDPLIGQTLDDRFLVVARIGSGSMGTVYRAKQLPGGRDVALKILGRDRAVDGESKARFLREARATSVLTSPHTVKVLDFGQCQTGELFLAMELLEGETLGQRLRRSKSLSVEAAVETARQALKSLAEAHSKGIVHRDLKPDNLFYGRIPGGAPNIERELVKVLDFGVAKMLAEDAPREVFTTHSGTVLGTPRYMSPEQAKGLPVDARGDLYSLGVILYHSLAGRPPFMDDDAVVVMAHHIKTDPQPIKELRPDLHHDIAAIVTRALAKDPESRPKNAETMSYELAKAIDGGASYSSGVRSITPRPSQTKTVRPRRKLAINVAIAVGLALATSALVYLAVRAKHMSGMSVGGATGAAAQHSSDR